MEEIAGELVALSPAQLKGAAADLQAEERAQKAEETEQAKAAEETEQAKSAEETEQAKAGEKTAQAKAGAKAEAKQKAQQKGWAMAQAKAQPKVQVEQESKSAGDDLRSTVLALIERGAEARGLLLAGDKEVLIGHLMGQLQDMPPLEAEESLSELGVLSDGEWAVALADLRGANHGMHPPEASSLHDLVVAVIDGEIGDVNAGDKRLLVDHLMGQLEEMGQEERDESLAELGGTSRQDWMTAVAELKAAEEEIRVPGGQLLPPPLEVPLLPQLPTPLRLPVAFGYDREHVTCTVGVPHWRENTDGSSGSSMSITTPKDVPRVPSPMANQQHCYSLWYTIRPSLPHGLSLSCDTGVLSGILTEVGFEEVMDQEWDQTPMDDEEGSEAQITALSKIRSVQYTVVRQESLMPLANEGGAGEDEEGDVGADKNGWEDGCRISECVLTIAFAGVPTNSRVLRRKEAPPLPRHINSADANIQAGIEQAEAGPPSGGALRRLGELVSWRRGKVGARLRTPKGLFRNRSRNNSPAANTPRSSFGLSSSISTKKSSPRIRTEVKKGSPLASPTNGASPRNSLQDIRFIGFSDRGVVTQDMLASAEEGGARQEGGGQEAPAEFSI
jgi:hypothetical protein